MFPRAFYAFSMNKNGAFAPAFDICSNFLKSIFSKDLNFFRQFFIFRVLHEDDTKKYKKNNARLLRNAKKNPSLWKAYYNHLEVFADIRNCYALTVHNSQGSTFDETGIDGRDLNKNKKVRECNQLWYVASSRARRRVFVVY